MSDFLTKKEFETFKKNLKQGMNLDLIKGEINKHFQYSDDHIQRDRDQVISAGTAIVFDEEYDVAPNVVISCEDNEFIATAHTITITGFTAQILKYNGGVGFTKWCNWIAIGRRA